jgi:hypothetical protein
MRLTAKQPRQQCHPDQWMSLHGGSPCSCFIPQAQGLGLREGGRDGGKLDGRAVAARGGTGRLAVQCNCSIVSEPCSDGHSI